MAAAVQPDSFVEVYVWLAKHTDGLFVSSPEGEKASRNFPAGHARGGHVSMGTFVHGAKARHISFWRDADHMGQFAKTFEADCAHEGSLPDVIIRLHHLAIDRIHAACDSLITRVERKEIKWDFFALEDITNVTTFSGNGATCTRSMLSAGGFGTDNYVSVKPEGPTDDRKFYSITHCDAITHFVDRRYPDIMPKGFFPRSLLLPVADAARQEADDKAATEALLASDRVIKSKTNESTAKTIAVAVAGIIFAVLGAIVYKERASHS